MGMLKKSGMRRRIADVDVEPVLRARVSKLQNSKIQTIYYRICVNVIGKISAFGLSIAFMTGLSQARG